MCLCSNEKLEHRVNLSIKNEKLFYAKEWKFMRMRVIINEYGIFLFGCVEISFMLLEFLAEEKVIHLRVDC